MTEETTLPTLKKDMTPARREHDVSLESLEQLSSVVILTETEYRDELSKVNRENLPRAVKLYQRAHDRNEVISNALDKLIEFKVRDMEIAIEDGREPDVGIRQLRDLFSLNRDISKQIKDFRNDAMNLNKDFSVNVNTQNNTVNTTTESLGGFVSPPKMPSKATVTIQAEVVEDTELF